MLVLKSEQLSPRLFHHKTLDGSRPLRRVADKCCSHFAYGFKTTACGRPRRLVVRNYTLSECLPSSSDGLQLSYEFMHDSTQNVDSEKKFKGIFAFFGILYHNYS